MRKSMILLAAAALCGCQQNRYTIEGQIDGLEGTVYLFDEVHRLPVDSAAVKDGAFRFERRAEAPGILTLTDSHDMIGNFSFLTQIFIEPGTITVMDDPAHPERKIVTGTPINDAATAFDTTTNNLMKEFNAPGTSQERRTAILRQMEELRLETVRANRDNFLGAYLMHHLVFKLPGREALEEIDAFSEPMRQTKRLKKLRDYASNKIRTEVGQPYIEIVQPDADGNPVTLSSVVNDPKVRYTLVDFWASWCGPCMGEVPHLKRAYEQYRKRGFEIYGVSFDQDREQWLKTLREHGMPWINVNDLKSFDADAARSYAVMGIPSNFLIDRNGVIVASNLRGEALREKLAELLD